MGRLLLLLGREPRLLLLEPTGVVALVRDPAAAVELEDPAGDVVEEVPVVGDGDDGARVLGEEPLEPGDRLGVEMVRRLVQEQQVRRGQEQPAQSDAPPLASGEVVTSRSPSGTRSASIARSSVGVERPRVAPVDLLLHLGLLGEERVVVGVWLGELRRDRVEAVEQVAQGRTPSSTLPRTSLAGSRSGSCGRKPTVAPAASSALPLDVSSTPAMIRSSVDFPAPFGPSTPIFAPGRNASVMLSSTLRSGP